MFAARGQTNSLGGLVIYALQAGLGLCSLCVSIRDDTMLAFQPWHVLNLPHRAGMTCMCRPRKFAGCLGWPMMQAHTRVAYRAQFVDQWPHTAPP